MTKHKILCSLSVILALFIPAALNAGADEKTSASGAPEISAEPASGSAPEKVDLTGVPPARPQPVGEWGDNPDKYADPEDTWGDPFTEDGDDSTQRALGYDGDGEYD